MLLNLKITAFKGLNDLTLEGFTQFNLIGGKNNIGKTTLLEAIALYSNPSPNFHSSDNKACTFEGLNLSSQGELFKSKVEAKDLAIGAGVSRLAHTPYLYFPPFKRRNNKYLVSYFNQALLKHDKKHILNLIRLLDSEITDLRVFEDLSYPVLHFQREYEPYQPFFHLGSGFNRMVCIILTLLASPPSAVLIDEIENGIHHELYEVFWEIILKSGSDHQIWATTHSLEMIKAFNSVFEKTETGSYFELARNTDTNKLVSIKTDMELLDYRLKHEEGKDLRGEV
jgi:AAA15 family ATPase/GTPase